MNSMQVRLHGWNHLLSKISERLCHLKVNSSRLEDGKFIPLKGGTKKSTMQGAYPESGLTCRGVAP